MRASSSSSPATRACGSTCCWWSSAPASLYHLASPTAGVFEQANLAAVATSGLFCLAFLLFLHHADRYERTPGKLAVAAFIGGGIGAPWAMALPGNAAVMDLYGKKLRPGLGDRLERRPDGSVRGGDGQGDGLPPPARPRAAGHPHRLRRADRRRLRRARVQVLEDMLYGQNAAYGAFGMDQVGAVFHVLHPQPLGGWLPAPLHRDLAAGIVYLGDGRAATPGRTGPGADGVGHARARPVGLDARPERRERTRGVAPDGRDHHRQHLDARARPALGRPPRAGYLHAVLAPRSSTARSPETEWPRSPGSARHRRKDARRADRRPGRRWSKRRRSRPRGRARPHTTSARAGARILRGGRALTPRSPPARRAVLSPPGSCERRHHLVVDQLQLGVDVRHALEAPGPSAP